jgi:DNA-binding MarR family transcriptional regulator
MRHGCGRVGKLAHGWPGPGNAQRAMGQDRRAAGRLSGLSTGSRTGDKRVAPSAQEIAAGAAAGREAAGAPRPNKPRAEPTLLYVIKQVELAARAQLDEIFRPIGMTALQYTALTVLERHPDLSSAQLARNSFVTAQTMADMVRALQARGLVERHRDAADRRRLVLALTADGRDLLRRYRGRVAALEERMLSGLTAEQATELRRSLAACRANLAGR